MKNILRAYALAAAALSALCASAPASAQATLIDAAYQQIHDRVCAEMAVSPCPRLAEEDARWAFVTTWCRRNPAAVECDALEGLSGGPVVIAFNHKLQSWRAIYGVSDANIDEATGIPEVHARNSNARVIAVVEDTNPLLYSAEAGAISETPSPAIAALQSLFDVLGPSIITAMGFAEKPLTADEAARITDLENAMKPVQCVTAQTESAAEFIRAVETDGGATYTLMKAKCSVDASTLPAALKAIEDAAEPLRTMDFCVSSATALLTLLDTPARSSALQTNIDAVALPPRCVGPIGELANRILARARDVVADPSDAAARKEWNDTAAGDIATLTRRKNAAASATKLVAAADALRGKEADLRTALRKIAAFETRLMQSAASTATKTPSDPISRTDIADFFVVQRGGIPVAWEKKRTRTLTVKESSPFADVVDGKSEVATSYSASVLSASLFDVAVAITHTQLASPVFGTVTAPAPTATNPGATKLVIARKDEDERSGQLALFVSYPVLTLLAPGRSWTRNLGLDLGVGTGENLPAFFLGGSWRMGPIRIGAGSTWQQVKALEGQQLGETVAAEGDIQLKNELDDSWYASFSLSLGETLNLFKRE
ncbi:MAG TPA: hypothetical protein VF883_19415 [Thermoanaerobaculia bacterium]